MIPLVKVIAINVAQSFGRKNNNTAIHTDKQVEQSKGFNLFPGGYFRYDFIFCGIPVMFTKYNENIIDAKIIIITY